MWGGWVASVDMYGRQLEDKSYVLREDRREYKQLGCITTTMKRGQANDRDRQRTQPQKRIIDLGK